jgi:diguanylate cyclase (GGDEF)-like protein/PAS domain S-box-containing protein
MTRRIVRSAKSHRNQRTVLRKAPSSPRSEKKSHSTKTAASQFNSQILPLHEDDLIRALMDNTTDRIYFKDRNSRFILVNQSTASFFGLRDSSQAVGKTDSNFFSDEHARQALRDEKQILATGQPLIGIVEKETWPDGHETWVSTTKLPLRDRAKRIIGTFGISRDITAQKQNEMVRIREEALREANAELEKINRTLQEEVDERKRAEAELAYERDLFRTMMDSTSDRIYFKDRESRFLLINRAQAEKFGLREPYEANGKTDFDFFTEEHAREAYNDEQQIISSTEPFINKEEKETWPDGHATWVSSTKFPLRHEDGGIIGTFGISRDITERKAIEQSMVKTNEELEQANTALQAEIAERQRAEAELAHEQNLFRTMMDSTSDRIYFKDRESCFLLINRAQAEKFGLREPSEANGKTDFDFFTEEHARQAFHDEQGIITSEQPVIGKEEKETWPDGRETWVSSSKLPLRDREGRIIGTFGISRDITERKNMELAIQMANEKLSMMVNWLEGRNREISVLNEMGNALEECRTPEEAFPVISREMEKLIPVDTGKLYLFDKERGLLECVSRWGTEPGEADSFSTEDCRGVSSKQVFNTATAIPPRSFCKHMTPAPGQDIAYLCIPLLSQGKAAGLLHLCARRKADEETLPDLKQQLAVMAADHISLALANLTLRENLRVQSIRDALTGLFNRRYLEESLALELASTKDRVSRLGVIMLDIDRLKQINDTFGHEAGDAALQAVGKWLHDNIRTGDISCRYGGDEFVLILPDASLEATTNRARKICEGIRKMKFEYQGRSLGYISVSVGVASFPQHGQTRDVLLASADSALYAAKQNGRDQVVVFVQQNG